MDMQINQYRNLIASQPSQPLLSILNFRNTRISILPEGEEFLTVLFYGSGWNYSKFIFLSSAVNRGSDFKGSSVGLILKSGIKGLYYKIPTITSKICNHTRWDINRHQVFKEEDAHPRLLTGLWWP
jgi:hypothetical protein